MRGIIVNSGPLFRKTILNPLSNLERTFATPAVSGTWGLPIQCRTDHAFIGEYYLSFVPGEDTSCQCSERLQNTRTHTCALPPTGGQKSYPALFIGSPRYNRFTRNGGGNQAILESLTNSEAFKKWSRTKLPHHVATYGIRVNRLTSLFVRATCGCALSILYAFTLSCGDNISATVQCSQFPCKKTLYYSRYDPTTVRYWIGC
ncbi:hypothetical protein PISMIDRAFT_381898 [Pisolithus microcarpus 441]|uniref:Uncharacterized protein n=1 Tax=Pisolithus microcarpus 441 TaxID=765257 RepID=A0A0D0ADC4_9AGAM|nr:hypothetical protein PISMIDRAFT_381898 [Pisolithus microcarpus 441]